MVKPGRGVIDETWSQNAEGAEAFRTRAIGFSFQACRGTCLFGGMKND